MSFSRVLWRTRTWVGLLAIGGAGVAIVLQNKPPAALAEEQPAKAKGKLDAAKIKAQSSLAWVVRECVRSGPRVG